jgi:cell division septation protein DedD
MPDEGLHEIQLNGKQLVFLFMTATVVAVVIFLCGVLVGRGVPAQRSGTVLAAEGTDPTTPDGARADTLPDTTATPATGASGSASPSSRLGLSYPERLEEPEPVSEEVPEGAGVREPFATTAAAKVPPPESVPAKPATSKPAATTAAAPTEPVVDAAPPAAGAGSGFVVQVAAVRQKSEADAIRGRLSSKGYPAFVTTASTPGSPTTYRVRVGKYPSKREADTVAAKLERDEQFKPWVTR